MATKKARQKKPAHKKSMKHSGPSSQRTQCHADLGVPRDEVKRFMGLYDARRLREAKEAAQELTQRYPQSAFAWKALGTTLLEDSRVDEALEHLHRSVELNGTDPLSHQPGSGLLSAGRQRPGGALSNPRCGASA